MPNRIFRGQIDKQPHTVNLPVAGAYLPGIFVTDDGTNLTASADGEGRNLLLGNSDFYGQDVLTAYASGDTGVAYRLEPECEMLAQFAAGTYAKGDALTIDANGRMAAAGLDEVVIAYYDGAGATLTAGDLDDIVIAHGHRSAPA